VFPITILVRETQRLGKREKEGLERARAESEKELDQKKSSGNWGGRSRKNAVRKDQQVLIILQGGGSPRRVKESQVIRRKRGGK